MKVVILLVSLFILPLVSTAQYKIMGFYPNGAYNDYVIIYGYHQSDGTFVLSHCRTNAIVDDIYSNKNYLDVNTCTIRSRADFDVGGGQLLSN